MKLFLILLELLLLACFGCVAPIQEQPQPTPAPVIDLGPGEPAASSIVVGVGSDVWSELKEWLGEGNTITLAKAFHIERPEVTLDLQPNTSMTFVTHETDAIFTFAKPLPIVTAHKFGLTFHPTLSSLTIRNDGEGIAATSLGKYAFAWLKPEAAAVEAEDTRPIVRAYSTDGCAVCAKAKRELDEAKELPFRTDWTKKPPTWVDNFPTFHWEANKGDWRKREQWDGLDKFVEMWKRSREPKKMRAAAAGTAHWTFPGRSRDDLIRHLQTGIHRHSQRELEQLSYYDLLKIHDSDHNQCPSCGVPAGIDLWSRMVFF